MKNLTAEQKKLVDEILERENPQRKVDTIVADTKLQSNLKLIRDMNINHYFGK